MKAIAYIGLGANLGDLRQTLERALSEIARLQETRLLRVSSAYRTAPVDAGGPDYLNAVAQIETALAPLALLGALQTIEQAHGRERSYRNAPRTLDLDVLLYADLQLHRESLTLPHPRLHERAFVLMPLLELAPELVAPGLGRLSACLPGVLNQTIERLGQALTP